MDVKELVQSLYDLSSKVLYYESLESKIETKKKLRAEEIGSVIKKPQKVLMRSTPSPRSVPPTAKNLFRYDNTHMPKNVESRRSWTIFLTVLLSVILVVVAARFQSVLLLGVSLIAAGVIIFVVLFGEPYEKYATRHKNKRDEAYQRDLEAEQKAYEVQFEKYKKDVEEKNEFLKSLDAEIENAERELAGLKPQIDADESIPDVYKHFEALVSIIGYLENKRADSLKEAINLYESETRERLHNAKMEQYAKTQAQEAQLQREAAERTERSAYLQRLAAERAASEAARQRQVAENAAEQQRRSSERMEAEARKQRKAIEKAATDITKKLDE